MSTVLVAGIGNLFLGDDGFGPEVVRRLVADPARCRQACGWSTTASAACTSPTTCSTACDALVLVDALPGRRRARRPSRVLEVGAGRRLRRDGAASTRTAWTRRPCSPSLDALGGELPPHRTSSAARPADVGEGIGLSRAGGGGRRRGACGTVAPSCSTPPTDREVADMCLGIPGQVVEMVDGYGDQLALVDVDGRPAPGQHRHARRRPPDAGPVGADPHGLRGRG